jgi:hypothetical protein
VSRHAASSFFKQELHHPIRTADLVHKPWSKAISFLNHELQQYLIPEQKL